MLYNRYIKQQILGDFGKGKIILLYGARRTGKTHLVKEILKEFSGNSKYYNCDLLENIELLRQPRLGVLQQVIEGQDLVVIDEAQNVENIGKSLKVLVDQFPQVQIIATGSSSFDLANKTGEPLVGRNYNYSLYGMTYGELKLNITTLEANRSLEHSLIYGNYPGVMSLETNQEKKQELGNLTSNLLYKDILQHENLKNPPLLTKILQALAFQIGGEVSLRKLAKTVDSTHETVGNYLFLLEKAFIIFSFGALSRNLRNEINKSRKYYFWDLGIRNSLIQQFNTLDLRNDIGQLWENYCVSELKKKAVYEKNYYNDYFWRIYSGAEVDLVREQEAMFLPYEFKWSPRKRPRLPKKFRETYPHHKLVVMHQENYGNILLLE